MVYFTGDQVASATMIHQLIAAWATDLDKTGGMNLGPLLTEDTAYMGRGTVRHGREAAVQFYTDRLAEFPGHPPTMRHVVSNLLIDFKGDDRARLDFLLSFYMSPQQPPIRNFEGPTALADVWMDVARGIDGHWRIASFDSVQTFIRGN